MKNRINMSLAEWRLCGDHFMYPSARFWPRPVAADADKTGVHRQVATEGV
jgi:hypothetical protein